MRDEKKNSIQIEIDLLKAKAEAFLAQAKLKETELQGTQGGLEVATCYSIGPGEDGTTELTVYNPKEQSIIISNTDLPSIINSLIAREALIRHSR